MVFQITLAHANARVISSLTPLNKPPLPLDRVCCQLNWEEKVEKFTDRPVERDSADGRTPCPEGALWKQVKLSKPSQRTSIYPEGRAFTIF